MAAGFGQAALDTGKAVSLAKARYSALKRYGPIGLYQRDMQNIGDASLHPRRTASRAWQGFSSEYRNCPSTENCVGRGGFAVVSMFAGGEAGIAVKTARVAGGVERGAAGAARPASSLVSRKLLGRQLASQEQMSGPGTPVFGAGGRDSLAAGPRLSRAYGGDPADWAKMTSPRYSDGSGLYDLFETHWYENVRTGSRQEFKTKFPRAENALGGTGG